MARATYFLQPRIVVAFAGVGLLLSACDETANGGLFGQISSERLNGGSTIETRIEERDVERPDIFETTDMALWDGRPSLGGVWVAHPDVGAPERVRVTNTETGSVIEAALFRRERELPGPLIQVSSDAAQELGLLAGDPTKLSLIVLRREEVTIEEVVPAAVEEAAEPEEIEPESSAEPEPADQVIVSEPETDPIASAAAAIEAVDTAETATPEVSTAEVAPVTQLSKPYIQVGIFSVESNALDAATSLNDAELEPLISQDQINGKTFWRVVVGPANTREHRTELLDAVKVAGFPDAYYVKE